MYKPEISQAQRMFNQVVRHLKGQGKQSRSGVGGTGCRYRGDGGTSCAVGCLISDKFYQPKFEGSALVGIVKFLPPRFGGNYALLARLQNVHDERGPDLWPEALRRTAQDFRLEVPAELETWA